MIPTALKVPPVGAEEMVDLARRVKQGDEDARERLIMVNTQLAASAASKYARPQTELWDELYAEALRWLIHAVDRYDPDEYVSDDTGEPVCFSTCAMKWLQQGILRHLDRTAGKKKVTEAVVDEDGKRRRRTVGELRPVQLDHGSDYGAPSIMCVMEDLRELGPLEIVLQAETAQKVREAVDRLDPRERYVVLAYFGLDGDNKTLREIGDSLCLSRQRVAQIRVAALEKLRRHLGEYAEAG